MTLSDASSPFSDESARFDTARLTEERIGDVLLVTLSNPGLRNALTPAVYRHGLELFTDLRAPQPGSPRDGVAAVVLQGADGHFCGGGNLHRLQAQRALPQAGQHALMDILHRMVLALRDCPVPVIASVEGACAGAGFSLALGADLVVAAENARFVLSYAKVGLTPDGGASAALLARVPRALVLEWLLEAAPVPVAQLHALGLVNRVVPAGTAREASLAWAARLAAGPRRTQARIKQLVNEGASRGLADQLDAERAAFVDSLYSDECGAGIEAFLSRSR